MSGGIPIAQNSQAFIPTPPTSVPASIAASGTYQTGIMNAAGFTRFAAACTLSQAGTIAIQRYIDAAGTIAVGAAASATLVGATPNYVGVLNDGLPAASWQVTVTNTGGSTGNLTKFALLCAI